MKKSKVKKLKSWLVDEAGVDIEAYKNEQITEKVAEFMTFPMYAGKTIGKPPLIALIITFILIYILKSYFELPFYAPQLIIFAFFALITTVYNGLVWGLIKFVEAFVQDINELVALSVSQTQTVLSDIQTGKIASNRANQQHLKLSDIFNGVLFLVILPTATNFVTKKIPLIGWLIAGIIKKVFQAFSIITGAQTSDKKNQKLKEDPQVSLNGIQNTGNVEKFYESSFEKLSTLEKKVDHISHKIANGVNLPLKVYLLFSLGFALLFLYGIYYFLF